MMSFTLTRGAATAGALTMLHASVAVAHGRANAFEGTRLHLGTGSTAHTAVASGAGGSIVRTIVGLLIVIAVIYGLAWIIRQTRASKTPATGAGLESVATLPLGTNRSLALVRVGTELHLIGIAEQSVTPIRTFTEDEAVEFGLPVLAPGGQPAAAASDAPPIHRAVAALRRMTVR